MDFKKKRTRFGYIPFDLHPFVGGNVGLLLLLDGVVEIGLDSSAVASAATCTTLPLELIVMLAGVLGSGRGGRSQSNQVEHAVDLALISQRWPADADAVRSHGGAEMASRRGGWMGDAGSVLGHVRVAVTCRGSRGNGDGRRR